MPVLNGLAAALAYKKVGFISSFKKTCFHIKKSVEELIRTTSFFYKKIGLPSRSVL
jgi:hypothetical protein